MKEELAHIIAEYAGNRNYLLELLHFWAWHPFARVDYLAIVRFSEGSEQHLEEALVYLLDNRVLRENRNSHVSLFSLTGDEPLHSQVLGLSRQGCVPHHPETSPSPILHQGVATYD